MRILFTLIFSCISLPCVAQQTAFEIFSNEVHPQLYGRCFQCHGIDQNPYHALEKSEDAYSDAKKTINLNFPEQSALWIRSFNAHCGKLNVCGYKDEALLKSIVKWTVQEKNENKESPNNLELISESQITIPPFIKNGDKIETTTSRVNFTSESGEVYEFLLSRLDENHIYLSDMYVSKLNSSMSIDGFEIFSPDLNILKQNFSSKKLLILETSTPIEATSYNNGNILINLPDSKIESAIMRLSIKNKKMNLSREDAAKSYYEGYLLPTNQRYKQLGVRYAILQFEGLKLWGNNQFGQLGQGTTESIGTQVDDMVSKLLPVNVDENQNELKQFSLTENNACFLFTNGKLKCWGDNKYGQLGLGDKNARGDQPNEMGANLPFIDLGENEIVLSFYLSEKNVCVHLASQKIKCWGDNQYGQLGLGDKNARGDQPNEMGNNLAFIDLGTNEAIQGFATEKGQTCVLFVSSKMKCWGINQLGQLGLGDKSIRGDQPNEMGTNLPFIDLGTEETIQQFTINGISTYVLFNNGKLKVFGSQFVYGDSLPRGDQPNEMGANLQFVDFGTNKKIQSFKVSLRSGLALFDDGSLKGWGSNQEGQLGYGENTFIGDEPNELKNIPFIDLGTTEKVLDYAVDLKSSAALLESGRLKAWGDNQYGQLGYGDRNSRGNNVNEMGVNLPFIDFARKEKVISFNMSQSSLCAIFESITMKCFGRNDSGQLGLSSVNNIGDEAGEMGSNLPDVEFE